MKIELPNIPKAPSGPVTDLAWRLMEGDWTALRPLQDALQDAGRLDDLGRLNSRLGRLLRMSSSNSHGRANPLMPPRMRTVVYTLWEIAEVLWFDLFAADASIDFLAMACQKADAEQVAIEDRTRKLREKYATDSSGVVTDLGYVPGDQPLTFDEAVEILQEPEDPK